MPMAAAWMVPVRSLSADSPVKQREDHNFPSNSFERGSKPWLETSGLSYSGRCCNLIFTQPWNYVYCETESCAPGRQFLPFSCILSSEKHPKTSWDLREELWGEFHSPHICFLQRDKGRLWVARVPCLRVRPEDMPGYLILSPRRQWDRVWQGWRH